MLSEFDYVILCAIARFGDGASATAIQQEVEVATGRSCSFDELYTALEGLEAEGLITVMAERAAVDRPRQTCCVTAKGLQAAASWYDRAWDS
jgi:hypothetical protein